VISVWGAYWGIIISNKWGGYKSVLGKAILFFSLGLLAQEFGQITYSIYFHFLHVDLPYPSIGDIGYFGSIPLYILGIYYLASASGAKIGLQSYKNKIQAIIIPLILLVLSYWFFLKDYTFDWSAPLTIFLDFGYPLGQAIYLSLAILAFLLSRSVLGGIMKKRILFVLFALIIQYVADYMFLFQSHAGTWVSGGINDYIYSFSYLLMTLALIQFDAAISHIRQTK
jgi:hypothetical protein